MIAVHPAFICLAGLLPVVFLSGRVRNAWTVCTGAAALIAAILLTGSPLVITLPLLPGIDTVLLQVDPMRSVTGIAIALAGLTAIIYATYRDCPAAETIGILASIGATLGIVYAGDFITVFIFWELLALASLGIIWSSGAPGSPGAGYRYLLFHIFGGACLLGGIACTVISSGSTAIGPVADGPGLLLMLTGIGVNAAFIPLHTWVPDAYPRASVAGSVALCIFTTKAAVFLLAVTGGWGSGVAYMGGIMAVYGAVFALFQDDIRRLLSYSIISQGGYMVAAIGTGLAAGVDAGLAHMVNDILFKSLLFMAAGAVIYRTGLSRLSDLGGLSGNMPVTAVCAGIGGLALAGLPGLNGAVSKGMVIEATGGVPYLSFLLLLAAVITVIYTSRLLYAVFFRPSSGAGEKALPGDPPAPMLAGMILVAALCIAIGLFPELLTNLLPGGTHSHPFAPSHLIESGGIFLAAGILLLLLRPLRSLGGGWEGDIDHLYRTAGRAVIWFSSHPMNRGSDRIGWMTDRLTARLTWISANPPAACRIAGWTLALPVIRVVTNPDTVRSYEASLAGMQQRY
ncbi:MAG: proton-conducting transporter membrane subunit, partial [Methanomicrobiaceae archaeon]|nr:proton-conducting transporter membrane subunit [Methanomicrobiaceae archaeon]